VTIVFPVRTDYIERMADASSRRAASSPVFSPRPVDKESPLPLYFQIRESLLNRIAALHEGDLLPPEQTLCELYGVSRPTVRQAIADLVQDGLLCRTAGRGTFITGMRVSRDLRRTFDRFEVEMHAVGRSAQTEILRCVQLLAPADIARSMQVEGGAPVWRVDRRRYADDESLVVVNSWLPVDLTPDLDKHRKNLTALRHTLENIYRLHLYRVGRRFEAVAASEDTAALLEIQPGAPIQFVETHSYLESGRCIEFSRAWYRGDRASFVVEVYRDEQFTNF